MIIGDLTPMDNRQDKGNLWENFLIAERLKFRAYNSSLSKGYFWRTVQQQEIDYVEEEAAILKGFEINWKQKNKIKIPKKFSETYDARVTIINRDNFRDFLN